MTICSPQSEEYKKKNVLTYQAEHSFNSEQLTIQLTFILP